MGNMIVSLIYSVSQVFTLKTNYHNLKLFASFSISTLAADDGVYCFFPLHDALGVWNGSSFLFVSGGVTKESRFKVDSFVFLSVGVYGDCSIGD